MTVINDTRVVRLQRTAARTGHQHSADERIVEEVSNELVTVADVVSLPPGSLITLQRGPGAGLTEEGSVLNTARNDIGGVAAAGQTTSVTFDSEDAGVTAAAIFATEIDFALTLSAAGEYAVNYKTFQVKTYTPVPTTVGSRILISYAWAPIREYLEWVPEDLIPDLEAFGDGPHEAGGGGGGSNVIAGCNVDINDQDGYSEVSVDVTSLAGPGLLVSFDDDGCPRLEVDPVDIGTVQPGNNMEGFIDGYSGVLTIGLDIQSIAGDGLIVVPGPGGENELEVQLDAYQIPFDDTNSPFATGTNVQEALESIDAYLNDLTGDVIRINKLGSEAFNAPANTIYDFGTEQYEVGSGRLIVYVNGLFQNRFTDYAELSTTRILFSDPLADDDELDVIIFRGNFAGGQDLTSFNLQLGYDNLSTKEVSLDNGELSWIQTQPTGSALRLYSQSSLTTALNVLQDGSGPGITTKTVDQTNPALLVQTDTTSRNNLINSIIVDRTTSNILGSQNNIGSGLLTRLENAGTLLFNASRISSIATDTTDSSENVDWTLELMDDGSFGERLRVTSDGKVGIGTTTPLFKLSVDGIAAPTVDNTYGLGTAAYRWQDGYFGQAGLFLVTNMGETDEAHEWSFRVGAREFDGYLDIAHNGETQIVVSDDGYVSIGAITPNEYLTVGGVLSLQETISPETTVGFGKIFVKSDDNRLYFKNSLGVEIDLSTKSFQTAGSITLSVNSSSGSDTPTSTRPEVITDGYYGAEPFLTIQAAVDSVPNIVGDGHSVVINVESGSYAGFSISGKIVGSDQFSIVGATGIANIAAGITSGTATSGSINTLTRTGAGWTVDNLEGKYLSITGGTGAGGVYLIKSNTSDTITTVAEMSLAADATSEFEIIDSKANITSNGGDSAGIYINKFYGNILIFGLNIEGVTTAILGQASENIEIDRCYMATNTDGLSLIDVNKVTIKQSYLSGSTGTAASLSNVMSVPTESRGIMITDSSAGIVLGNTVFNMDGLFINNTTNNALNISHSRLVSINNLAIDTAVTGLSVLNSFIQLDNADISNCSTKTFDFSGTRAKFSTALTGTGNTGFGVLCNSPHSLVELNNFVPTITGTGGNASINGVDVISWGSTFNMNNTSSLNNITGARIVRFS